MTSSEVQELAPESPYIWRARKPGALRRLICFPHAGAGASAYAEWAAHLPDDLELVAVQLPGRQDRIAEEPFTEVGPLVAVLSHALRPVLDLPFAFFGHSGGATLAFELTRTLRARGLPEPGHLFLSGRSAPGVDSRVEQLHGLPDARFCAAIADLGGFDDEILEDDDLLETMLYTLRADFALWEQHRLEAGPPLDCPITVLCGDSDPRAPLAEVEAWEGQTTAAFTLEVFPGGHFYFLDDPAAVAESVARRLCVPATSGRTA
jgi:medium-chain acyl-[acyl-carrier-protein] hydrolase